MGVTSNLVTKVNTKKVGVVKTSSNCRSCVQKKFISSFRLDCQCRIDLASYVLSCSTVHYVCGAGRSARVAPKASKQME